MRAALRLLAVELVALSVVGSAWAVTWRVPQQCLTIQDALNNVQDGDTVLVAVGVYAEALRGTPHSHYVLRGDVVPDSSDYPRPVVDPSTLPQPETVTCLILDSLSHGIVIEDFAFRNGPEMYGILPRPIGGVANYSTDLTVRRCLFDSTYGGVWGGGTNLSLHDCRFEHNYLICARTDSGPIIATNCLFSCDGGFAHNVSARDHSSFRFCEFRDNTTGELLVAETAGDSIMIENCLFGPWDNWWSAAVLQVRSGCEASNCLFTGCLTGVALVDIRMNCANTEALPLHLSDNTLTDYRPHSGPNGVAIASLCFPGDQSAFWGNIENNVFADGESSPISPQANALNLEGRWTVTGNRFTRLDPPAVPDVHAFQSYSGPSDTLTLRDNLFDSSGVAATTESPARIDARWNWWGDSTGPYNASLNPNGQGGEVGSRVDFIPWHPDTSFLRAPEPHAPLPQQVSLELFPNPFNATATLILSVNRPGIFEVTLFNLLGQRVQNIWSGAVAQEKRIPLDGASLPSGLYFVRVWQPIENRPAALAKVVIIK